MADGVPGQGKGVGPFEDTLVVMGLLSCIVGILLVLCV